MSTARETTRTGEAFFRINRKRVLTVDEVIRELGDSPDK